MICLHTEPQASNLKTRVFICIFCSNIHMYILLKKIPLFCYISPYSWSMHQMLISITSENISHRIWTNWEGKKKWLQSLHLIFFITDKGCYFRSVSPKYGKICTLSPITILLIISHVSSAIPGKKENVLPARIFLLRWRGKLGYGCSVFSSNFTNQISLSFLPRWS